MNQIIPGEKYRDTGGRLYQVTCTAISASDEGDLVIIQQLFGDFLRIAVPRDRFREKMKAAGHTGNEAFVSDSRSRLESETAGEVDDEKAKEDSIDTGEGSPELNDMLSFLDTDDFEEKFRIAKRMAEQNEIDDTVLDNMAASLDFIIDDGPIENRIDELLHCIATSKRFETTRLRNG